jgi:hypothetical protein
MMQVAFSSNYSAWICGQRALSHCSMMASDSNMSGSAHHLPQGMRVGPVGGSKRSRDLVTHVGAMSLGSGAGKGRPVFGSANSRDSSSSLIRLTDGIKSGNRAANSG